jgi:hypothetical protein
MIGESRDFLAKLDEMTGQVVRLVSTAPAAALEWRPGSETNAAPAIVTHALGATRHWIVAIIGGRSSDRVREQEFRAAAGEVADLEERVRHMLAEAREVMEPMSTADFDATCQASRMTGSAFAVDNPNMSVRSAALHVIEHLGTHIGHLELTLQLFQQQG